MSVPGAPDRWLESPWCEETVARSDKAALMRVLYESGFIEDFVLAGEGGAS